MTPFSPPGVRPEGRMPDPSPETLKPLIRESYEYAKEKLAGRRLPGLNDRKET